jgi:hypothetical protein
MLVMRLKEIYLSASFRVFGGNSDCDAQLKSMTTMRANLLKGAAIIQTVLQLGASAADYSSQPCRYLPSDKGWPSLEQWQTLNTSVSGHLLKPLPAAHVCHDPTHDEKACSFLKENWIYPSTQYVL